VFEIAKTGASYASTPTTLISFNGTNGANPVAGLIADAAGDLFGTTTYGGTNGDGTVFELANNGGGSYALTTLISFNGTNGASPYAGLIADAAGDLFGTTTGGGASGLGTVFEIAKTGGSYASTPTTLLSFNGTNGEYPYSGLIADAAGNLFGTTPYGGGYGTVFELSGTGYQVAVSPSQITVLDTSVPSETVGGPYTGNNHFNAAMALSGLSVSASPNAGDPLSAVLSVSHGTITVGTTGGATISSNGTGSVTLSGTAAQIDAALAGASYRGSLNYYGPDSLSVATTDTADGKSVSASAAITLVNDPGPSAGGAAITLAAGLSTDLTAYLLSLDRPGIAGDTLTLTGDNTTGTLGKITLSSGDLSYLAPAASGTVSDQYGDTASATVTVTVAASGNIGNGSGTVVVGNNSGPVGFGNGTVTVVAGSGNNQITGGNANNTITAGNGTDTINLGNGASTVTVGNGNDTLVLGNGANTLTLGTGNDSVTVGGGNNTITIAGSASSIDTIKAGNGNNTLTLGAGTYNVALGNGANAVNLGNGMYNVTAGTGAPDVFIFTSPPALLTMKFSGNDELVFHNSGFDLAMDNTKGTGTPQAIDPSLFGTFSSVGTSTDRFAYNQGTGSLYYSANGSIASETLVAHLTNDPHLTAASLFFVS